MKINVLQAFASKKPIVKLIYSFVLISNNFITYTYSVYGSSKYYGVRMIQKLYGSINKHKKKIKMTATTADVRKRFSREPTRSMCARERSQSSGLVIKRGGCVFQFNM